MEGAAPPPLQNMGEDLSASLLIGCLGIALALQKRAVVGVVYTRTTMTECNIRLVHGQPAETERNGNSSATLSLPGRCSATRGMFRL